MPEPNDDPNASQEQLSDNQNDENSTPSPTVKFGEVEVSQEEFERLARERYKDQFEAHENRDKWQAKLTQEAQQQAELRRKAERFDLMSQDPRFQPQDGKSKYIEKMSRRFPDLNREFLELQYDQMVELTGERTKEAITPLMMERGEEMERNFLSKHPDVQKGSEGYQRIVNMFRSGADLEDAYEVVYKDQIRKRDVEEAIKKRDEEAKRKLKGSSISGRTGTGVKSKIFSERSKAIIDQMYD